MLYLGPIIFGFIIGFILGTRFNTKSENTIKLTAASFAILILIALFVALQLGQFPYYNDSPLSTGFVSAAIGLVAGKLIFGK